MLIRIYLGKQQALGADPKAIHWINFTGNLERERNAKKEMFFITEGAIDTILNF